MVVMRVPQYRYGTPLNPRVHLRLHTFCAHVLLFKQSSPDKPRLRSPEAVAEHAVALLLALIRKLPKAYNRVREHNFNLSGLEGFTIHGKTIGVLGQLLPHSSCKRVERSDLCCGYVAFASLRVDRCSACCCYLERHCASARVCLHPSRFHV
eukprot:2457155-Rhodomonas_salina.2